ncbi:MAG TPA: response regulator [Candidatus Saccharimonadales bacterium]|nr:response regulator [Candidatus Saccharimonadales bacterium]
MIGIAPITWTHGGEKMQTTSGKKSKDSTSHGKGYNILIVEDEKILSDSYIIILERHGFHVDIACNGREGVERCKSSNYDLILLDIMMPILDGIGFLRVFSKIKMAKRPRVILLSNMSIGSEIEEALKLGAHKFMLKSQLEPDHLLKLLRRELAASA